MIAIVTRAVFVATVLLAQASFGQASEGRLEVTVRDEQGEVTPARVRLVDTSGRVAPLPAEAVAVMYGHWDHADGYGYQPDSTFYTAGSFGVGLPEGLYVLTLTKGHEYLARQDTLKITRGATTRHEVRLERWIDMPARGWYSTDGHIHVRRSPREDSLLLAWTRAEDVHVGVMLRMGDFWEIYYAQYAWGKDGVYQRGDYLLTSGQEDPRTPELGHALGMGMSDRVRYRDEYYLYDKVFDRIRELGGVAGYAHQAETFHGYRGLVLDGLRGKVDVLELLQFCAPGGPLILEHYYHLLDLGFDVTAVAGSDFPWCGKDHNYGEPVGFEKAAQIGNARFYVYVEDDLKYDSWKEALRRGRTFVSSGPMIEFAVNDSLPGAHLDAGVGELLQIRAVALSNPNEPLDSLQIVAHGAVVAQITPEDAGRTDRLEVSFDLPVERGIWIAARAFAGRNAVAHTTPIYVHVDGSGFVNPATLEAYLRLSEAYLDELEALVTQPSSDPEQQAWMYRSALEIRIQETRAVIDGLRARVAP